MFHRLVRPLKTSSFFLFGARGTGKTTYIKKILKNEKHISFDLLDPELEDRLSRHPNELRERIDFVPQAKWVFIDEVQKIPKLLDIVHKCIEEKEIKFILTGSSARKLKRGHGNLLAGRAFVNHLYPLTNKELGNRFNLKKVFEYGSLPAVCLLESKEEKQAFLRTYTLIYVKEEIKEEQVIRKLDPFRQFLEVSAQCNGEIINYSNIARDVRADIKTVQSYFEILEDTLLGYSLDPFHLSIRKRQRTNPKFYYFDLGVKRALDRTLTIDMAPRTYAFGKAFEHFIITEIMRFSHYNPRDYRFFYLRTKDNAEIDLIIERPGLPFVLIEIKSTTSVTEKDIRHLKKFRKSFPQGEAFCLSMDPLDRISDNINLLHWQKGLEELGII